MLKRTFSLVLLIFCIVILSACNLAQESPEITATEDNTITPVTTINTATMTNTAPSTIVPSTQTSTATSPALAQIPTHSERSDCVISQTNLSLYIVRAGDTLSNIASRANTTASYLAELNCLRNTSYILVGQQLIVPNAIIAPTTSASDSQSNEPNPPQQPPNNDANSINVDNIPYPPTNNQGNLVLSDWNFNVDQKYIIETGNIVTFTWQMPDNNQFTQVGFVAEPYVDDFRRPRTLIGTDTDLSDGATIRWTAPTDTQTYIFAVGQVAGQSELVASQIIRLGTEDSSQEFEAQSIGFLSASPIEGQYQPSIAVIEDGSLITLSWTGMNVVGFRLVDAVYFYYEDEAGNTSLIGQDNDDSDGITITWQTPTNISGMVYAEGLFMSTQYNIFRRPTISNVIQIQSYIED